MARAPREGRTTRWWARYTHHRDGQPARAPRSARDVLRRGALRARAALPRVGLTAVLALVGAAPLAGSAPVDPSAPEDLRQVVALDRATLLRQEQVRAEAVALANALALADAASADAMATRRIAPEDVPPDVLTVLDDSADRLRGLITPGGYGPIPPGLPITPTDITEASAEVFQAAAQVRAAEDATAASTADLRWTAPSGLEELEALAASAMAAAAQLEGTGLGGDYAAATEADLCPIPFAPDHRLRCVAIDALVALNAAFRAEHGRDLEIVSSFRTLEQQAHLRSTLGSLAALPGTSNHEKGIAVDFGGVGGLGDFTSPVYQWLLRNAPDYGWVHPPSLGPGGSGPQEPWHWEFIG